MAEKTAVLLMPHMGRRKFSMGGKLHGRNMLISEYIFVICVAVLGDKEIFRIDNSNDSIEQMGRKQVSSHMQVVKKFFEDLRCCTSLFIPSILSTKRERERAFANNILQSTSCSPPRRRGSPAQPTRTTSTRKKSRSPSSRTRS